MGSVTALHILSSVCSLCALWLLNCRRQPAANPHFETVSQHLQAPSSDFLVKIKHTLMCTAQMYPFKIIQHTPLLNGLF